MSDPLRVAAGAQPDAPALDDGHRVWSYAELDAAVERMARRLEPLGAAPGATVALAAHQGAPSVQALFALPRTGATVAVLNPRLGPERLERALDTIGPDLLLSTEADVQDLGLDPGWFTTLDDLPKPPPGHGVAMPAGDGSAEPDVSLDSGEPYALLFTSGTSGEPGVVPVTLGSLDASSRAVSVRLDLRVDDRWYGSLSFAHIGGLALVHRVVHVGCRLVVRGQYSVRTLVQLIDHAEITHASLVPAMLRHLLDERADAPVPASLRCLVVGGAAASEGLVEEAVGRGYPVALTYGLTEACSQVATAPPDLVAAKPGTVGFPLDGIELRLLESGEICVRGPTVTPSHCDEDGWLSTGDYGLLDADGHLSVSGRVDERIISGGVNVDPRTVENVIQDLPGVAEVAVVGVPDDTWGEVVGALIVPRSEALDLQALESAVRERVPSAEVPRLLALAREMPRNANGKIDRVEVRALLTGRA